MVRLHQAMIEVVEEIGLVRVDGLFSTTGYHDSLIGAKLAHRGMWNSDEHMLNITTPDGQIFAGSANILKKDGKQFMGIVEQLCPNGKGGPVYLSKLQQIRDLASLFARIADPYHDEKACGTIVDLLA